MHSRCENLKIDIAPDFYDNICVYCSYYNIIEETLDSGLFAVYYRFVMHDNSCVLYDTCVVYNAWELYIL